MRVFSFIIAACFMLLFVTIHSARAQPRPRPNVRVKPPAANKQPHEIKRCRAYTALCNRHCKGNATCTTRCMSQHNC